MHPDDLKIISQDAPAKRPSENQPAVAGSDGLSAYQIAVNHGFTGSETEWLASLKGERGQQGERGPQGERGSDGLNGNDGAAGAQGVPGKDGERGSDGLSAYQIAVNHGFTGSETEWLASLKGERGQQGERGPQGERGSDGLNGNDGAAGAQGVPGKDGERGSDGLSAYQIAVNHGFTGSETEWLASLKGSNKAAETIQLTREMWEVNGYPFTRPGAIVFKNTYQQPIFSISIQYNALTTMGPIINIGPVSSTGCQVRASGMNVADIDVKYKIYLSVIEA